MAKTFYHFILKYKNPGATDEISVFANHVFRDHGFPSRSKDYDEISRYLEAEGDYLPSMAVFDRAWELYTLHELEKE